MCLLLQLVEFSEFAQVFPLRPLGFTPDPGRYLFTTAVVELCLGFALLLGPSYVKRLACKGFMLLMAIGIHAYVVRGVYAHVATHVGLFLALLVLHRILASEDRPKRH